MAFCVVGAVTQAGAEPLSGLTILSGQFGTLGAKRKLDIAQRLQQLCGTGGASCSVFCSETSFGRYRLGSRPICRVIYRCPDATTRSVEAASEEPILLRCEEAQPEAAEQPTQELKPPPYVPPAGH